MKIFSLLVFAVAALGAFGWVANLVKVIGNLGDLTVTPMFVARAIGVFAAPIGAILGFF